MSEKSLYFEQLKISSFEKYLSAAHINVSCENFSAVDLQTQSQRR